MIRFVDMRPADIAGVRFAFWNTIKDRFVEIGGEQAWDEWAELEELYPLPGGFSGGLERLQGLCPPWVFEPEPDEEERP